MSQVDRILILILSVASFALLISVNSLLRLIAERGELSEAMPDFMFGLVALAFVYFVLKQIGK